jgi:hypothetical protein
VAFVGVVLRGGEKGDEEMGYKRGEERWGKGELPGSGGGEMAGWRIEDP